MTNPNRANSGHSAHKPQATHTMRLTPAAYEQVERQCKPLDVGTQTSELQAAYVLGQQSVLAILRKDIVVGV
jgi:hypothetical protein